MDPSEFDNLPPIPSLTQVDEDMREIVCKDLWSSLITFCGAAVQHSTKCAGLLFTSSMGQEAYATNLVSEKVTVARDVARAIGRPQHGATVITTDNKSNMQVAMRKGSSNKSRHLLRHYYVLHPHCADCIVVRRRPALAEAAPQRQQQQ